MGDRTEIFGDVQKGDTLVLKGSEELKTDTRIIPLIKNSSINFK